MRMPLHDLRHESRRAAHLRYALGAAPSLNAVGCAPAAGYVRVVGVSRRPVTAEERDLCGCRVELPANGAKVDLGTERFLALERLFGALAFLYRRKRDVLTFI